METTYIIHDKPMWKLEAVCSIVRSFENECDKLLENSVKFGQTKERMQEFLDKYLTYSNAVLSEVLPIYNKKYTNLEPYFKKVEINYPVAVELLQRHADLFVKSISDSDIDYIINDYFERLINDLSDEEENKYDVKKIEDVISLLNEAQLNNDNKMLILSLHVDRYKVIRALIDFIDEAAPICEKYYFIIEEEFVASYNYINDNNKTFSDKIKGVSSIELSVAGLVDVYINIFLSNTMSMNSYDGINLIFVGIHFFELVSLADKNKYNDAQMVAGLKSIADATRYKILCMLSEKPMYMQQIAYELGLSAANVSHHINTLLHNNMISIIIDTEKNKRIYYEVNREEINKLVGVLKQFTKDNN